MKLDEKLYVEEYKIDTNLVNFNKKLGLFGLMGILQDAASEHAEILGFGYHDMLSKGIFWVLSRQKIIMKRWPDWREKVRVETWTKPVESFYAYREFELFVGDEKIGECSTTWLILDSNTHRPKRPEFIEEAVYARADYSLNFQAGKVTVNEPLKVVQNFKVHISDLDMNNHVNNTRYIKWILDSIPIDYHNSMKLKEFEINFLNETFLNEIIEVYSGQKDQTYGEVEAYFKGVNTKNQKPVFMAKLTAEMIKKS